MNKRFSVSINKPRRNIIVFLLTMFFGLSGFAQEYMEECEDTCRHIHGIDISHYQGEVFWEAVGDNAKNTYVYIKATEGGDRIDERYEQNIRMARRHGLKVGSYHFFRPKTDLATQLRNFTTQCRPELQDLIPMIDIETRGGLSIPAFCDSLMKFIGMVEKYYHRKPLLYTGANFYDWYLSGKIDGYPLMIAQYTPEEPRLSDGRDITLWQYTGKGHIEGIRGYVDKSRFMGQHTLRELRIRGRNQELSQPSSSGTRRRGQERVQQERGHSEEYIL